MKYKCLLFDLDHTLWDYETNSREALSELYLDFGLNKKGIEEEKFLETFYVINNELWDQYDRGLLHRDVIRHERFHRILLALGVNDYDMSIRLSHEYIAESPKKKNLIEGCKQALDYLHPKYPMVIVTNGFDEIQSTKLMSSGIDHYFKSIVTSARAGHKKPAREIFEFALRESNVAPTQAIMIGDNLLTDIAGAENANIDTVFFNPNEIQHSKNINFEIKTLTELTNFL
ncbi:MAG: noncanonical pyrimidine nucleotidase, YjjG family [Bacteroidetes bacterium]|nr:noncanonical pyrimidine nucleotidase, YjjG family [Bacteroidota bacterium]MBI3483149.1 noncanonical pyrimidine nucleotidase, YjjG family [Bacteroidota bacterium]